MFDRFVCPRCHGSLESTSDGARCARCAVAYPTLSGVPCLLDEPELWRTLWKGRLDDYLTATGARMDVMQRESSVPDLLESTRSRIRHVHDALVEDRTSLIDLFRDVIPPTARAAPALLPPADPRAADTAVIQHSENLFRDWVWGQRENAGMLELVRRLATQALGHTAVYGVGTGRLALDIHRELGSASMLGLDVNPLPLLVTARLLAGDEIELHEYPLAPNSLEDAAFPHRLKLAFRKPENLELAFADALRPPLAPGSLDTVVTPWFIDAVPADVRETAAAIHRVLRPGGAWLNFGPLRFEGSLARQYVIGEVHEIVKASGFELGLEFSEVVPYFHSPHSGAHRNDRIFAFAAKKAGECAPLPPPRLFPPWLSDTSLPIPVSPAFGALQNVSVLTVGILSMIDGRRSVRDIAQALAAQWGVPENALEQQLLPFLARLPFS